MVLDDVGIMMVGLHHAKAPSSVFSLNHAWSTDQNLTKSSGSGLCEIVVKWRPVKQMKALACRLPTKRLTAIYLFS